MIPAHFPKAGEVFLAVLDPTVGSEQGGSRPVIIFQTPDLSRYTSTLLCVPVTTNLRRLGVPGTCRIAQGDGGLRADSVALGYQLLVLDRTRLQKYLGTLAPGTVEILADAILGALGVVVE